MLWCATATELTFILCVVASLVVLGTFAPELQRESGIIFYAVAFMAAALQLQLRITVALKCGFLVPFDSFLHVWRVVPFAAPVTLRRKELSIGFSTSCRSQIPGRCLPFVTLNPFAPTVKATKIPLALDVTTIAAMQQNLNASARSLATPSSPK
jgi:hypothetical protein